MRYQGPRYFRETVFSVYERIKPSLSRKDVPHVLVGGIERISCSPTKVDVVGDFRLNRLMDTAFEALCGKNSEEEELETLNTWREELYKEATHLPEEAVATYDAMLDLLVLSPDPILHYMMASCVPMEHVIASNSEKYIEQVVFSLHYPYLLAGQFVLWDLGETKIQQDIQSSFRQLELTYDKKRDGKFSQKGFINKGGLEHLDIRKKLVDTLFTKDILRIDSFEEAAALIVAIKATLPLPEMAPYEIEVPSLEEIDPRLIKLFEKDQTTFLHTLKQKIDASYGLNLPVFNLLEKD